MDRKTKEYNKKKKSKAKKKIRVDPLIHWIDCLLYEKNDILK